MPFLGVEVLVARGLYLEGLAALGNEEEITALLDHAAFDVVLGTGNGRCGLGCCRGRIRSLGVCTDAEQAYDHRAQEHQGFTHKHLTSRVFRFPKDVGSAAQTCTAECKRPTSLNSDGGLRGGSCPARRGWSVLVLRAAAR